MDSKLVEDRNIARAEYFALSVQKRKKRTPELTAYDNATRRLLAECKRMGVEYPD